MNDLERFQAVAHFEEPDYVPIFGFPGAPGMSRGAMPHTHQRLISEGMPDWVGGSTSLGAGSIDTLNVESWFRYWGTTGPDEIDFFPGAKSRGIKEERRIEGEWEIIEYETGAYTRQVIDNDALYSMPEFRVYHVRDRKSWELYRDLQTPGKPWSAEEIDRACIKYENRTRPLMVSAIGTWGSLRSSMGVEKASTVLYDDPDMVKEIMDWNQWKRETYYFPLIERLRPEIIHTGEDMCYNHGLMISPDHFREFCAPHYRRIAEAARDCGADMVAVDCDGNLMELAALLDECGVNALFPFEVKAGNDLFALREQLPRFIMMGGLEKEVVNAGNEDLIESEIMTKVPPLLKKGGYFPNGDHGIQPLVTFSGMCRFMTHLHEVTGNPEGEFPRVR